MLIQLLLITKKFENNNTAIQIFTKKWTISFFTNFKFKTSVVYSARGFKNINFENLIKKYNNRYSIFKINEKF